MICRMLCSCVPVIRMMCSCGARLTAGILYRAGAETPPNFRENFWVSLRTIFSAVDTQTAILVSTVEVGISALDTQPPVSLGLLGIHHWFWFFCSGTAFSAKIRVSGPAPSKNPDWHRLREAQLVQLQCGTRALDKTETTLRASTELWHSSSGYEDQEFPWRRWCLVLVCQSEPIRLPFYHVTPVARLDMRKWYQSIKQWWHSLLFCWFKLWFDCC